ncbi:hypothetical protein J3E69DRAFT_356174 [Trichoderma sp. SZMC 28015]
MVRGRRLQITDKESHVDLNGSSNGHAISRPDLSLIVVDERLESQRIAYGVEFGACKRRSDTSSPLHQGKSQADIEARVHSQRDRTLTRDRVHGSLRLAHDEPVHRS